MTLFAPRSESPTPWLFVVIPAEAPEWPPTEVKPAPAPVEVEESADTFKATASQSKVRLVTPQRIEELLVTQVGFVMPPNWRWPVALLAAVAVAALLLR